MVTTGWLAIFARNIANLLLRILSCSSSCSIFSSVSLAVSDIAAPSPVSAANGEN